MTLLRPALLLTALAWLPLAAAASPPVQLRDAWSRATMSTETGGVYLTIVNQGAADALVGADTPAAAHARLHRMSMEGNVMTMRPLADLPIAAGETVRLDPAGDHIMLEDMKQPLGRGQTFPITLHFRHAGAVSTTVRVGSAGAQGPGQGPGQGPAPAHGAAPAMDMSHGL